MREPEYFSPSGVASEASRRTGKSIPPRVISDLLYARKLDSDRCPIIAGRRLIPADYLEEVLRVLDSWSRCQERKEGLGE
jgi:hypothetical protein